MSEETLQNTQESDSNYLMNFWKPQPGHKVVVSKSLVLKIKSIDPEYPSQVFLENLEEVYYLQDLDWEPEPHDFDSIFETFGVTKTSDGYLYNKSFFLRPETKEECIKTIQQVRLLAYGQGKELLDNYFGP